MKQKSIIIYTIIAFMVVVSVIGYFKVVAADQVSTQSSGLTTARIEVITSAGAQERWEAVDGYAGQFPMALHGTVRLRIQLVNLEVGKPLSVEAPHGGVFNGKESHFTWTPQGADETLELSFQVGRSTGVYLITLRQGQREETIEFWAGEPKPLGEVGPQTAKTQ